MEISRQFKPAIAIPTDTASARPASARPTTQPAARPAASLPLEQMHDALRAMPEVDLDRVAAIKQALQRGEITADVGDLASSMLSYHRGNDA
ncbi:flagellar biosynthesis anti-sigma factor FlgM [Stutzerimonas chloritidismutans]|uniref:Negative regulator of flagellin synthesis n=1 Tax=Stutzerimonas chloritidismutans TaxID=203192 RepID=A0ABU9MEC3_STUCH